MSTPDSSVPVIVVEASASMPVGLSAMRPPTICRFGLEVRTPLPDRSVITVSRSTMSLVPADATIPY